MDTHGQKPAKGHLNRLKQTPLGTPVCHWVLLIESHHATCICPLNLRELLRGNTPLVPIVVTKQSPNMSGHSSVLCQRPLFCQLEGSKGVMNRTPVVTN